MSTLPPIYSVWLIAKDNSKNTGLKLDTPLPENFSIQLGADWNPDFAGMGESVTNAVASRFLGDKGADAVAKGAKAAGFVPQPKPLTALVWGGSSYIELAIPFVFKVDVDPVTELINPIKHLMRLTVPYADATTLMLQAPFAIAKPEKNSSGNFALATDVGVSVHFGKFLTFPQCIITNVGAQYDCIFDKLGRPLSAKVDVSLKTLYCVTLGDIDGMFNGLGISVSRGK